jgi:ribonuclease T1
MLAVVMNRWWRVALLLVLAVAARGWLVPQAPSGADAPEATASTSAAPSDAQAGGAVSVDPALPPEARETLRLIAAGGPFPYDRDGTVFQNRERLLPSRPRGHYREYTVPTPGSRDRGARRIVTGGEPPAEFYYTDDHYRSFRRIEATDR